jgi:hypothetical protein
LQAKEQEEEMTEVRTYARVKLTVEVRLAQPWGEEDNLAQVYKVARRDGLKRLSSVLHETRDCFVVGDPEVTAVLVRE